MIIDFYIGVIWIDCCNTIDNDPQNIKAILEQRFQKIVTMVERCNVTYTKGVALDFSEWLQTI